MMGKGLIVPGSVQWLVNHKDYAVKMVNSIIKDMNLDPCGKHSSGDLGILVFMTCHRYAFVSFSVCFNHHFCILTLTAIFAFKRWCE